MIRTLALATTMMAIVTGTAYAQLIEKKALTLANQPRMSLGAKMAKLCSSPEADQCIA